MIYYNNLKLPLITSKILPGPGKVPKHDQHLSSDLDQQISISTKQSERN